MRPTAILHIYVSEMIPLFMFYSNGKSHDDGGNLVNDDSSFTNDVRNDCKAMFIAIVEEYTTSQV